MTADAAGLAQGTQRCSVPGLHRRHRGRLLQRLRHPRRRRPERPRPGQPELHDAGRPRRRCRGHRRAVRPARSSRRRPACSPAPRSARCGPGARGPPARSARPAPGCAARGSAPASPRSRRCRRSTRATADHGQPDGARGPAVLPQVRRRRSGRSRDGRPGRTEGFCPQCRHAVLVHPEAEAGRPWSAGSTRWSACLAHGGLGWIYLARDTNVLRTAGSCSRACSTPATPTRYAAAVAERRVPRRGRAPAHRRDLQLRRSTRAPATS